MSFSFKFSADGSEFTRGLSKMKGEVKAFAKSAAGIMAGAFLGGKALGALQGMVAESKELAQQAKLFSTSTQIIQKFGKAAEASNFTLENMADAMHDMTEKAQDAAQGNKTYAESFAMMGLSAEDFINMNFEEKVRAFGNGLKYASKNGLEFLAANDLAGGAAQEMIGTFKDGGDAFFKLADSMNAASDAQINTALKLGSVWRQVKELGVTGMSAIFQGLLKIGVIGAASAEAIWVTMSETVKGLGERFLNLGKLLNYAITGNVSGAKKAFLELGGVGDKVASKIEAKMKTIRQGIKGGLNTVDATGGGAGKSDVDSGSVFRGLKEAEERKKAEVKLIKEQKKIEEDIAKTKKEIAEIDQKASFDKMNNSEKLLDLEKRRVALSEIFTAGQGQGGAKELSSLQALKGMQSIELQMDKVEADQKSTNNSNRQRRRDGLAQLKDQLTSQLDKSNSELSSLRSGGVSSSVVSSSLRSIGGGGSAVVTRDPALQIAKRQESIQEKILEVLSTQKALDAVGKVQKEF